jgi:trk system potassium uptake protein TrkA
MTFFSGVPAEIIEITIADEIPSLGRKLRDVKAPKGMIVASILRGEEIIIPTGKDELLLHDRVICFVLPESLDAADSFFASNLIIRR